MCCCFQLNHADGSKTETSDAVADEGTADKVIYGVADVGKENRQRIQNQQLGDLLLPHDAGGILFVCGFHAASFL